MGRGAAGSAGGLHKATCSSAAQCDYTYISRTQSSALTASGSFSICEAEGREGGAAVGLEGLGLGVHDTMA